MNSFIRNQKICLKEFVPSKVSDKIKLKIPKETLRLLYWDKKFSTSQIAKIYGCDPETIRRYMIKSKINRRELHQRKYQISKEKLEGLYLKEKLSTIEIAKKYGCSQWVIWALLQYYDIEARNANDYHLWKSPVNQIKPILNPSPILAYVIGVILGDGWTYKRGYCYFIGLEALDRKFCESFHYALKRLNLNPSIFQSRSYWRVVCSSKLFYEWFKSLTFIQIKNLAEKYPVDFLRGIYESEGSLSVYRSKKYYYTTSRIVIVNTNKELINLIKHLLENLDFNPHLYKRHYNTNWKPLWVLILSRKSEVNKFLNETKPCIKIGEKRRNRNL